jgi:hypothetical protein
MTGRYYLLVSDEKKVYLQVSERKRKQISEVLEQNSETLRKAGVNVQRLTQGEYNAGCSMAALPELGKGIELCLIE